MSTLPLRTLCLCVKCSSLSSLDMMLSALGCELSPLLSPLPAPLARNFQLTENKATLSPFPATLTRRVTYKSFVCRSYKKHGGGVGCRVALLARHSSFGASATRRNARNSNPLMRLLHDLRTPRGGGGRSALRCPPPSPPKSCPQPSTFDFQLLTFNLRFSPPISIYQSGARVTEHGSRGMLL